ncbi:trypsin 5G1-like [Sabethes cyaneus]|uniref:trypsin 5G1-like n=1 Tax=Sabethes cyaneus TaxID=53552 RepID=UPI00237E0ABF|nr:trypsin 5G1-like [Sabethes cyaneus]
MVQSSAAALWWMQSSSRIIGGKLDKIENNPWLISISSREFGGHFCGGSLLTPSWVFTAAHCLNDIKSQEDLVVRAGSDNKNSGGVMRKVRRFIKHPDFERASPLDMDYGLIETRRPFELGPKVAAIQLASYEHPLRIDQQCKIAGWGLTKDPTQEHRPLKSAIVKIGSIEDCRKKYYPEVITSNMICAGGGGNDACQGDSGGPIVCNDMQFGVVSWGRECGLADYYGIYASVSVVRSWIFDYVGV